MVEPFIKFLRWDKFLHSKLREYFISLIKGESELVSTKRDIYHKEKILVYLLGKMGDVVFSTPVIEALRGKYPEAFITYATRREYRDILTGNPNIDEIYYTHNFIDINRLVMKRKFDKIIPLHVVDEALQVYFKEIVDIAKPRIKRKGVWYRWGERLIDLYAENAGVELKKEKMFIDIPQEIMEQASRVLQKYGVRDEDYIISFHTRAFWRERTWPIAKFYSLAKLLLENFNRVKIVILGARGEYLHDKEIINLAGKLRIKQTAAIIKRSKLFIGVASGLGHIATAVKTPAILLFGSEDPKTFESMHHFEPIVPPTQCNPPCFYPCTKPYYCIDDIEVATVYEKAKNYIGKNT